MTKLIFGCGYLGSRVAQIWLSGGHEVYALTRSGNRAPYLRRRGINPIIGNVAEPGTLTELPEAERTTMDRFIWGEMLFFGIASILAAGALEIRLVISIWRTHNLGTA